MPDLARLWTDLQEKAPLVHCITNAVTVNDCANILLACGASPIMADDPEEVEEITARADGLVLNLGTLHRATVPALFKAGKKANELGHPVVLDPVGVGASAFRRETARQLLEEVRFAVVRCNASELRALGEGTLSARGVDADGDASPEAVMDLARAFARETGAVVAVTGAVDVATDGDRICLGYNGHPMLRRVTGTGCMLSALTGAFVAAAPDRPWEAACAAVIAMACCGELAHARLGPEDGAGTLHRCLLDAVSRLTGERLEKEARYETR